MAEGKLTISDFNREELLDILSLLYVQGDRIIVLNNKMQKAIKANRQLRLKQATKRKKNRIANIAGLVFCCSSIPLRSYFCYYNTATISILSGTSIYETFYD